MSVAEAFNRRDMHDVDRAVAAANHGDVIGELSAPKLQYTNKGYFLNINNERVDALGRTTRPRGVAAGVQRHQARQTNEGRWWKDQNTRQWYFQLAANGRWVKNGGW